MTVEKLMEILKTADPKAKVKYRGIWTVRQARVNKDGSVSIHSDGH